jgi:hypothetical protein
MVDLVRQSWNIICPWVFEASEAIVGLRGLEKSPAFWGDMMADISQDGSGMIWLT